MPHHGVRRQIEWRGGGVRRGRFRRGRGWRGGRQRGAVRAVERSLELAVLRLPHHKVFLALCEVLCAELEAVPKAVVLRLPQPDDEFPLFCGTKLLALHLEGELHT
jgi:hypothetical protein